MSLINCPECKKEVSTSADACPHCGYPIKKKPQKVSYPAPIDDSWVNKYIQKLNHSKKVAKILTIISLFPFITFFLIYLSDLSTLFMVLFLLFTVIFAIPFGALFSLNVYARIVIRKIDGYTVLVYIGFGKKIVIENREVASGISMDTFHATLPNKKTIWISISFWTNSVMISLEPGIKDQNRSGINRIS